MKNFFKFTIILIIGSGSFLINKGVGASLLNQCAPPYFPEKKDHKIAMVVAKRKGTILCAPQAMLLKLLSLSRDEMRKYQQNLLDIYFWTAVYNGYHLVVYKIVEASYDSVNPTSDELAKNKEEVRRQILSILYTVLANNPNDWVNNPTNELCTQDRNCFAEHAARLKH